MTLDQLRQQLENLMRVTVDNWYTHYGLSLRAEIQRKCEQLVEAEYQMLHPGPICPCPVVGEAKYPDHDPFPECPKCGKGNAWYLYDLSPEHPCPDCTTSRPPAPSGYEHVGEWRPPKAAEHFLNCYGDADFTRDGGGVLKSVDNGCRWILRKVAEEENIMYGHKLIGRDADDNPILRHYV